MDQEPQVTSQIFELVKQLNPQQRFAVALAIVRNEDRPVLEKARAVSVLTPCGHSPYDPCHNCDGVGPGMASVMEKR